LANPFEYYQLLLLELLIVKQIQNYGKEERTSKLRGEDG
jgi:hypothetical protein